eukprot:10316490-Alexandrium_andersonii.AAC.1
MPFGAERCLLSRKQSLSATMAPVCAERPQQGTVGQCRQTRLGGAIRAIQPETGNNGKMQLQAVVGSLTRLWALSTSSGQP